MKYYFCNFASLFCLVIFLSACSTTLKIPTNRFSLPESNGIGAKRFSLDYSRTSKINTGNDPRSEIIVNEASVHSSDILMPTGAFSPLNSLDIEYAWGIDTAPYLGLKWQLIGDPYRQAKAMNFSLALRAGQAIILKGDRLEAEEVQPPGYGYVRKYVFTARYNNLEVITGFRPMDWLIMYAGYFANGYSTLMEYTYGDRTQIRGHGKQTGKHIGFGYTSIFWSALLNIAKVENQFYTNSLIEQKTEIGANISIVF